MAKVWWTHSYNRQSTGKITSERENQGKAAGYTVVRKVGINDVPPTADRNRTKLKSRPHLERQCPIGVHRAPWPSTGKPAGNGREEGEQSKSRNSTKEVERTAGQDRCLREWWPKVVVTPTTGQGGKNGQWAAKGFHPYGISLRLENRTFPGTGTGNANEVQTRKKAGEKSGNRVLTGGTPCAAAKACSTPKGVGELLPMKRRKEARQKRRSRLKQQS